LKRRIRILLILLTLAFLDGCSTCPVYQDARIINAPGEKCIRSELMFGLSKPDNTIVSEEEWRQFVDNHITPRFKDGLTIIDDSGQWLMQSGMVIKEPSKIVILLHRQSAEADKQIENIRSKYKALFQQESVLMITEDVAVSF